MCKPPAWCIIKAPHRRYYNCLEEIAPQKKRPTEKVHDLLQLANISNMDEIQNLFNETITEFMENGLELDLDDELSYSKYDCKNKDTDNSRNGNSRTLCISFGNVDVSVP